MICGAGRMIPGAARREVRVELEYRMLTVRDSAFYLTMVLWCLITPQSRTEADIYLFSAGQTD